MFYKKKLFLFLLVFSSYSHIFSQSWRTEYDECITSFNDGKYIAVIDKLAPLLITQEKNIPDTLSYFEMNNILGISYLKTGKSKEAEAAFQKTIKFYQVSKNSENHLTALINLALTYYSQKQYENAAPCYEKAIAIQRELTGDKNRDYIVLLNNLANVSTYLKKYTKADSLYQKILTLKQEVFGNNSLEYAITLKNQGNLYKNIGKYNEAEPVYLQAAKIYKDTLGNSHPEYINILNNLGSIYKNASRYPDAEKIYVEVLGIKKEKGETTLDYAAALINLALLYKLESRYAEAEPLFKTSLTIYKEHGGEKSQNYIITLVQLAGLYRSSGQYQIAEDTYKESQKLFKETLGDKHPDYASLLNNIALLYDETGRYDQAEDLFLKVLETTKASLGEKHPEYATSLNNLALLYKDKGQYEKAEPLYKESMKIRKEVLGENHPEYGASLNNLAELYQSMGRGKQSEPLYIQAASISKKIFGEKHLEYASSLINLAALYEHMDQYDKSEKLYNQALEIIKSTLGEMHPDYAIALNNLALLQQKIRKYSSAEQLYKKNLELTQKTFGNNHPSYATSLCNLGGLYENMGRYSEAEKIFRQALQIRQSVLSDKHPDYASVQHDLARVNTIMGRLDDAEKNWNKALSNYMFQINTYFPSMSEKEKEQFYHTINDKLEQFNSFSILRSKSNPDVLSTMYNNQLATKALLFNASNKVRQRILNSGDKQLTDLFKAWQAEKELLAKLYSQPTDEIRKRSINIDSLEKRANDFERELSIKSELFKNNSEKKPYVWKDIQKKLKPGEAAVEIIRFAKYKSDSGGTYTDSVYYAALILSAQTSNHPTLVLLKNGRDLEGKYIRYYKNTIKFKAPDDYCYNEYWKKIKAELVGVKKVYFSPDGVYNQINLNSIKNLQTNAFIFDEIDIQIVTNTKDMMSSSEKSNSSNGIILFGNADFARGTTSTRLNTLPGTETEIKKIDQIMLAQTWTSKIFTKSLATEESLKNIKDARVIHIATHGFFQKDIDIDQESKENTPEYNPLLRSGLMLAGASVSLEKESVEAAGLNTKEDDGILSAYEAMNLNLDNTELVVLSACETGLGDIKNGEGVYGLQRAFRVAGSKSIIISLWKVNDETTQKLMTAFYSEWLKSNDKRQAFREAQLIIRNLYPDPYNWAAFIIIGE
jgi:CHAT domain-containing protein/tetratricopeptide (TPR) repeat protein